MRCLIVANRTLGGDRLADEVRWRTKEHPDSSFHVLVPASPLTDDDRRFAETEGLGTGDGTESVEVRLARSRLRREVQRLEDEEVDVTGDIGDADPVNAVEATVDHRGEFDEIILSTQPAGISRWLKMDLPHRLERRFGIPVRHIEADVLESV